MTAVCIGNGPSVTQADVDACRGLGLVLVINTQWHRAPWADVLYSGDLGFWATHGPTLTFPGRRYACTRDAAIYGATVLQRIPGDGWSDDPQTVYTGGHSGYQALQLAVKLDADTILLLGYDMHPSQPKASRFARWLSGYPLLAQKMLERGVRVVNCSPQSVLECFPRQSLTEALRDCEHNESTINSRLDVQTGTPLAG